MFVIFLFLFTILRALRTKPFSLRFCGEANARKMEPLNGTLSKRARTKAAKKVYHDNKCNRTHIWIVATNHFTVGDLVAQAIRWLIGIHRHIHDIARMCCGRVR